MYVIITLSHSRLYICFHQQKCMLCSPCVSSYQREILKDAYLEHINRGSCRRIFPPAIVSIIPPLINQYEEMHVNTFYHMTSRLGVK